MMMDEDFAWFLKQFGRPTSSVDTDPVIVEKFRGRLPEQLLAYWQELGFCGFKSGLFWIVNPDDYEDAMDAWLGDTEIVERDSYYVIARTAFGKLYLWGSRTGHMYDVNAPRGWIYGEERDTAKIGMGHADECLRFFFGETTPSEADFNADDGKPLFDAALARYGALGTDEVFAFEPALAVGGCAKLENIVKRNVHVHLHVLAQFGQREILDRQTLTRKAFG